MNKSARLINRLSLRREIRRKLRLAAYFPELTRRSKFTMMRDILEVRIVTGEIPPNGQTLWRWTKDGSPVYPRSAPTPPTAS